MWILLLSIHQTYKTQPISLCVGFSINFSFIYSEKRFSMSYEIRKLNWIRQFAMFQVVASYAFTIQSLLLLKIVNYFCYSEKKKKREKIKTYYYSYYCYENYHFVANCSNMSRRRSSMFHSVIPNENISNLNTVILWSCRHK